MLRELTWLLVRVSGGINAGNSSLHVAVCIEIFKPDVFDPEPVITRRSAGCVYYNIRFGCLFFSARVGVFYISAVRRNGSARSENTYPALFETAPQNALMSLSIVGAILSACSITDTLHPSAFRYSAASSPDAPPPIIAALFGIASRLYTSLTSVISAPGISSCFGFEPVQMSRF